MANGITTNRKWHLILFVVIIATLGTFLPPLLSVWLFKAKMPLIILSGTEYVSLMSMICGFYFGANVAHRYVETKNLAQQMDEATATPAEDDKDKEA